MTELRPPLCNIPLCTEVAVRRITYDDGYASGPGWDFCLEHTHHFRERCLCQSNLLPTGELEHRVWCPCSERAPKHTMTPGEVDRYYGNRPAEKRRRREV